MEEKLYADSRETHMRRVVDSPRTSNTASSVREALRRIMAFWLVVTQVVNSGFGTVFSPEVTMGEGGGEEPSIWGRRF
jgi:hypothetical protein